MTIELPKTVKTYLYRPLTMFTTADTDVDRVLPHLFEACVKGGRPTRILTNERDYPGYRDRLLASEHMAGFDVGRIVGAADHAAVGVVLGPLQDGL